MFSKPSNSNATQYLVWAMKVFAFMYFVVGLLFFFMPEETFYLINIGPKVFGTFQEIPVPVERFWLVLATSMMAMLSLTALLSSQNPHVKGYLLLHMLSKSVSVAGFLYSFIRFQKYFAYLVGAVTDFSILVLVAVLYLKTLNDSNNSQAPQ